MCSSAVSTTMTTTATRRKKRHLQRGTLRAVEIKQKQSCTSTVGPLASKLRQLRSSTQAPDRLADHDRDSATSNICLHIPAGAASYTVLQVAFSVLGLGPLPWMLATAEWRAPATCNKCRTKIITT